MTGLSPRGPFSTSMVMGGRVKRHHFFRVSLGINIWVSCGNGNSKGLKKPRQLRQFSESVDYLEELGALDMHLGGP